MPALTTSPWTQAIARFGTKTLVGSKLRSAEWAQVPLALREGAMFSAGVENARTLSAIREKILAGLTQARPGGTGMDRARFVADLRNLLGADEGDSGQLTDLTSRRRLELIWDFQAADAHGHAAHQADLDPDLLDAFPAQRLIRIEARRTPRDWFRRWAEAGSAVGWEGASRRAMVALKTSPIWSALSRFGRPWPPFDYGSGMGLEDVDRDEAEALDLLPKGEDPAARMRRLRADSAGAARKWTEAQEASVRGLTPEARSWLSEAFGEQLSLGPDTARWRTSSTPTPPPPAPPPASPKPKTEPQRDGPERIVETVARAQHRAEAHAAIALPPADRGALAVKPTRTARAQATQASDFISTVMHQDVAPEIPVRVRIVRAKDPSKIRSHYDPVTRIAHVREGDVAVTVHELAHHIECTRPEIHAACRAFLASRAKPGETPRPLAVITGDARFKPNEIALEDDWVAKGGSVYSGKVYPSSLRATEVLTMGLQRLFEDPIGFARQDPEYLQFILRVLRPKP